jgi:pentose-5-phosphate-3-epimerase
MDPLPEFSKPTYYEIRVSGRLSKQGASWFEDMHLAVDETLTPVQTFIRGHMEDQAALHGLISRIRDLGLTLVSVNRIEVDEGSGANRDNLSEE